MKLFLFFGLFVSLSMAAEAADIPAVVNANTASSKAACIQNATNECINSSCINSSALNCTQGCQTIAENQCKGKSE